MFLTKNPGDPYPSGDRSGTIARFSRQNDMKRRIRAISARHLPPLADPFLPDRSPDRKARHFRRTDKRFFSITHIINMFYSFRFITMHLFNSFVIQPTPWFRQQQPFFCIKFELLHIWTCLIIQSFQAQSIDKMNIYYTISKFHYLHTRIFILFFFRQRTITTSAMSAASLESCRIPPHHLRRTASNDQKNVNLKQSFRAFESTNRLHDNKYYTK